MLPGLIGARQGLHLNVSNTHAPGGVFYPNEGQQQPNIHLPTGHQWPGSSLSTVHPTTTQEGYGHLV